MSDVMSRRYAMVAGDSDQKAAKSLLVHGSGCSAGPSWQVELGEIGVRRDVRGGAWPASSVGTMERRRGGGRGGGGVGSGGIFSGPIDLDGPRRRPTSYATMEARPGLAVRHRASGVEGTVVRFEHGGVAVRDRRSGQVRLLRLDPGGFEVDGLLVSLLPAKPAGAEAASRGGPAGRTASGSTAVKLRRARVAQPSRILVEGIHDAELVEKVWGDDLRVEGVVVERLDGMDDLADVVADFRPEPGRRLGVLLDHLVEGSKETRAAAAVRHPHVLVSGTPYVDVWQAVRPRAAGIGGWPSIPPGQPWKEGVLAALGVGVTPGEFWRQLLGRVTSFADLEPALVGAVEELIDFVTAPA
jgi:Protein of unknown function (DUF3097)